MGVITLLTDFGYKDPYVAEMKGVILSITNSTIIDITHEVTPYMVEEGAFLLYNTVKYFAKGTIHVAVVDPGVGTNRRSIIIETKDFFLVGPDNGLLIPSARLYKDFKVFEIKNRDYILKKVTYTFHGRDIFAPVAAHLANGVSPYDIGKLIDNYVDLDFKMKKVMEGNKLTGKVLHIDRFGNVITNIDGKLIKNDDREVIIKIGNKEYMATFVRSYGFLGKEKMLLTVGGHGMLEIGVNQGDASKEMRANVGDYIEITL